MSSQILIVDDEEAIRFSLRGVLEDEGHTVLEADSGEKALRVLEHDRPDLIFLDIWMPNMDGLKTLEHIRALAPQIPVVMISGHGTIETAVSAIKLGAHDFIEKPLSLEKIDLVVSRALEMGSLVRENQVLRSVLQDTNAEMLGNSTVMHSFKEQLACVAPTEAWVLITGENGTGKELAARAIHAASKRAKSHFVAVNCAAIPEELIESELFGHEKGAFTGAESSRQGRFEMAHKGTLFLDEIADMSLKTQAKILRILQEQRFERIGGTRTLSVDVRVIAATNKNLEEAIQKGSFREDLYYRLRVFPLTLPPLRERTGDVPLLLSAFTRQLARQNGLVAPSFDAESLALLNQYPWPGNVRELRNFVERMLILHHGHSITPADLPQEMQSTPVNPPGTQSLPFLHLDFKAARSAYEALYLQTRLHECNNNVSRLAEVVNLERSHLHRKLKGYHINGE